MSMVETFEVEPLAAPHGVPYNSIITGRVTLFGFAVEETSGVNVARLLLYDGADQTSTTFYPIRLAPGESTSDWFGPNGLHFRIGLLPVVTAGAVDGMIYVHTRDRWPAKAP